MGRIVSFLGTDHKCGTSMISLCIAKNIASLCPSLNVLLVYAQNKISEAYSPKICEDIDSIWPYVKEEVLDIDEMAKKAKYEKNLSIIGGQKMSENDALYSTNGCEYLYKVCKEKYDIIICDAGCEILKPLCIGTLKASDEINLVLVQNEQSFIRYELQKALYQKNSVIFEKYILNKYNKDSAYTKDYCTKRLCIDSNELDVIVDSGFGDIAEMQSKSLLEYKSLSFKRGIENISRRIISDYGKI